MQENPGPKGYNKEQRQIAAKINDLRRRQREHRRLWLDKDVKITALKYQLEELEKNKTR